MGKLLQLIILGVVAWVALRILQGKPTLPRDEAPARGASAEGGMMRRCAYCQVHIPEGECTRSRGNYFCGEAHRDAYFREQGPR
ncbi:MAG TPA: PP0621 family protein [Moraxellaceae bacterium]|nr:PP0621 family protein [Moraxellaceae bacterium]